MARIVARPISFFPPTESLGLYGFKTVQAEMPLRRGSCSPVKVYEIYLSSISGAGVMEWQAWCKDVIDPGWSSCIKFWNVITCRANDFFCIHGKNTSLIH